MHEAEKQPPWTWYILIDKNSEDQFFDQVPITVDNSFTFEKLPLVSEMKCQKNDIIRHFEFQRSTTVKRSQIKPSQIFILFDTNCKCARNGSGFFEVLKNFDWSTQRCKLVKICP